MADSQDPSSVLITKPDGETVLFDLADVQMSKYDPTKKTLTLEFKNQSTSTLTGGPWVEQLWEIMKRRAGFHGQEDKNRSAFSRDLSVKYSGKLPDVVPPEPPPEEPKPKSKQRED